MPALMTDSGMLWLRVAVIQCIDHLLHVQVVDDALQQGSVTFYKMV